MSLIDGNFERLESMASEGEYESTGGGWLASIIPYLLDIACGLNKVGQISLDDFQKNEFLWGRTPHFFIGNPTPSTPANPYWIKLVLVRSMTAKDWSLRLSVPKLTSSDPTNPLAKVPLRESPY